jgi:hypothetical protein
MGANIPVVQKLLDHLACDLVSHGVWPNFAYESSAIGL